MSQRANAANPVSAAKALADVRAARTREAIVDVAIPLFVEQGYDETSMEQVADVVGVSRRTLYRWFGTKEDIVFELVRTWLAVLEAVVADRRPRESTREVLRRGLLAVADAVQDDHVRVRAAFSVLGASPMLAARHGRSDAEWVQRHVGVMAADGLEGPTLFEALVMAMAVVAGQNAVMIQWAGAGPDGRARDLMEAMLDQLDGGWPEPCRRPPS